MREWENANIKFDVCSKNSEDSNLFLRKFYDELSHYGKVGWSLQPWRENKIIHVGNTNKGTMWLEYIERGKISKIYFKTYKEEDKINVEAALQSAQNNHYDMKNYTIIVTLETNEINFCDMSRHGIKIYSMKNEDNFITSIIFSIHAFGEHDLEYVKTQKIHYLMQLLCVYTNITFKIVNVLCNEGVDKLCDNNWQEPNQDWMDIEDEFINVKSKTLSISSDFFALFRKVIDTYEYEREIRLLLNSSQEMYCSKKMINTVLQNSNDMNGPGYIDLINTLMISALEPLACIYGVEPEHCTECGNLKYSIRKKVRDLCDKYLPQHIAKEIYDKGYSERSAFLHEGYPVTNEFYCGHFVPLINPVDGRSILYPVALLKFTLFDYITYIFRKVTSDVIKDISNKKICESEEV